MSIFDNVAFPLRQNEVVFGKRSATIVCCTIWPKSVCRSDVTRKRPAELSGGMRKRVGLARALILRPELVVYDEPTTGLDPIMSDVINELILDTRRRYPVTSVVVTHDMHTARKVADRVLMFYPAFKAGTTTNHKSCSTVRRATWNMPRTAASGSSFAVKRASESTR